MSSQCRHAFETVLEKPSQQRLIFGQGNDAVADVARWQDVEFLAQASAGTAIVSDSNYRSQVADAGNSAIRARGIADVVAQSLEVCRYPSSAPNGDDSQTVGWPILP